jgi:hypothetical protein
MTEDRELAEGWLEFWMIDTRSSRGRGQQKLGFAFHISKMFVSFGVFQRWIQHRARHFISKVVLETKAIVANLSVTAF